MAEVGPDAADLALDGALEQARRLVARAATLAVTLADIDIGLPPPAAAQADAAQLRAVAGLYLVAELEAAGVIPVVEALAALGASGGLSLALGGAAAPMAAFWRDRNDRPAAAERAAAFTRLFGHADWAAAAEGPAYDDFVTDMIELTEALYKLDELGDNPSWGGVAQQARVRRAAERLIDGLVASSGALTAFIAGELLETLRQALAILRHHDLQRALRVTETWRAVEAAARLTGLSPAPTRLHAERGRAGMTVIAWLAEAAPHLAGGGPLVGLDHPVVTAAVAWLQAALAISEVGLPRSRVEPARSAWASLAA